MASDLTILRSLPSLQEWLVGRQWKGLFGYTTQMRSQSYAGARSIRDLDIEVESNEVVIVTAKVVGTAPRPYLTLLEFSFLRGKWGLVTDCSCPVEDHCKHAAGLMAYISGALDKVIRASDDYLAPEISEWLREIEKAAQVAGAAGPEKPSKPENRFLAYCIEKPLYAQKKVHHFVLRVGTRQKDGSVKISQSRANADPSRPPKYMTQQDLVVTASYFQRYRKLRLWSDMPLEGSGWEEILEAAHATGNLYFGEESYKSGGEDGYQALIQGPPEVVEALWENATDGSVRPVLRCENADLIILPTQPLRYLDPISATFGLLQSVLPPAVLAAWEKGPKVLAKNLNTISARFAGVTSVALPTPTKVETETHKATAPVLHFRVHSRILSGHSKPLTVGQLTFTYSDSPPLPPLAHGAPESHILLRAGKRHIWPRSLKQERALENKLRKLEFISLDQILNVADSDVVAHSSFVPAEPFPTPQLAWLKILESPAMDKHRAAGWIIEIDPKAGLTAHDATEFFPAIETDPDHGIDWFRFDISYEINGQRLSLIPIIAEALQLDLPEADNPNLPEFFTLPCENPQDGFIRFPAKRLIELVDQVRHLFHGNVGTGPLRVDRLAAAAVADTLSIDSSKTTCALAKLGHSLKNITALPPAEIPSTVLAALRPYQVEGFRWLQFLSAHGLHGILADDMGLGKTLQTLTHLAAECAKSPGHPSLVIAPTSVVPNWAAEAEKFTPHLKVLTLQGKDRATDFGEIATADIVITSYPLLTRDFPQLSKQDWHIVALDEAQYIKNPKALAAVNACKLKSAHRLCLSGTPMENHLGELWSLMRFLMPGFLSDEKTFNTQLRRPIERDRSTDAQLVLNRRVSSLILRRTKDQVATELPAKTEIIHGIDLNKKQTDLYESVRAAMDQRVRDAISAKGLAKSHIIVLDALLKLRQICCHPQLLKIPSAQKITDSAKLDYLTTELLPTLIQEGRKILLFSTFTSMLALIEKHLIQEKIPYLKLTGQTKDRATLVKTFQAGQTPIFLISLKAGGTGLNLTAADTVIHYDPWWNPAAENQATDRAHRIGQTKPVFVHKLICRGTIEDRILELQKHKSTLVEALLSEETNQLKIDVETLSHLLAPLA
jgi:hypothetical protein